MTCIGTAHQIARSVLMVAFIVKVSAGIAQTTSDSFIVEPNHPIVYLHIDHFGFAPSENGKSQQRAYLELHNNCTQAIQVRTFGSSPGDLPDSVGVMDELVLNSDNRLLSKAQSKDLGSEKMPLSTSMDVGSLSTVTPGMSLRFSLPADHFGKRWAIHIPFTFKLSPGKCCRDENAWGGEVQMFLSYSFYDLPPAVQHELEKSKFWSK